MPGPALRSPSARAGQIAREIDRDERVVLLALGRRLATQLHAAFADTERDLPAALDAMTASVVQARVQVRTLNDARIARRAERPQAPGGPWLPPELHVHACHGDYLGAFTDLAAVGRMAFRTCLIGPVPEDRPSPSPRDLALALHLDGALWTIEHAGRVHVFRCRGAHDGSQIGR
jgi:hypothetical protein